MNNGFYFMVDKERNFGFGIDLSVRHNGSEVRSDGREVIYRGIALAVNVGFWEIEVGWEW
jgi:hypothetical protein